VVYYWADGGIIMDLAMKNGGKKWGRHIGNILGLTWINYSDRTAMALEWLG